MKEMFVANRCTLWGIVHSMQRCKRGAMARKENLSLAHQSTRCLKRVGYSTQVCIVGCKGTARCWPAVAATMSE